MIALTQQNDSNMINDRKNKTEIYVCDSDKHTHTHSQTYGVVCMRNNHLL